VSGVPPGFIETVIRVLLAMLGEPRLFTQPPEAAYMNCTTLPARKLLPLIVSCWLPLPATMLTGERLETVGAGTDAAVTVTA